MSNSIILSIETSCDETSVSVVKDGKNNLKILSNEVSSQVKLHAKWGGVVPNLAAREHVKNIAPIFHLSLKNAGISIEDIDVIAVTHGPGLIPALMVGANFAKTTAFLEEKPLIGIHHIEGHIYANFIEDKRQETRDKKKNLMSRVTCHMFPILCLVVSGGHTQLVYMKKHLSYEIIGQTLDDSVGEAFDKIARILHIGYPGGPEVALWASKFQETSNKRQGKNPVSHVSCPMFPIKFPRPMLNKQGFNFSFSGLKTAVLYETKKHLARNASHSEAGGSDTLFDKKYVSAVCHEFQQASIDVLVSKTLRAAEKYKPRTIMLAGGVSANKELRKQLGEAIKKLMPNTKYCIPDISLTGDNAAMIGAAAAFRWQNMTEAKKKKALLGWKNLQPDANLKMR